MNRDTLEQDSCNTCGYEEGSIYCKEHCPHEANIEQEPCEDEYIKVPKKALKYRTAGMVAYNAEWLKNHFDIERVAICGKQEPCDDCISRQAVTDTTICDGISCNECPFNTCEDGQACWLLKERVDKLPPVTPQPKTGHWISYHHGCEYECSECHDKQRAKSKYCPNCGARMKGDTE